MITGATVGRYHGEIQWDRIGDGVYQGTGPRGTATITRACELVKNLSWARTITKRMTVWNISTPIERDARYHPVRVAELWGLTLAQAKDVCVPILCTYKNDRRI